MTLTPSNWDQGFHEGMASMIPGTEERDATIRSIRDWADTLASAIAEYLDIEIGDDNRWEQARIAFEKFAETDERDATIAALTRKIEELEKGQGAAREVLLYLRAEASSWTVDVDGDCEDGVTRTYVTHHITLKDGNLDEMLDIAGVKRGDREDCVEALDRENLADFNKSLPPPPVPDEGL